MTHDIPESVFDAAVLAMNAGVGGSMRQAIAAALREYDLRCGTIGAAWKDERANAIAAKDEAIALANAHLAQAKAAEAERDRATLALRKVEAARDEAIAEGLEQARLLGIGGSREAKLKTDLAAAQKEIAERGARVRDLYNKLGRETEAWREEMDKACKAESALTAAGYTRCPGEAGWKPPLGKRPLSVSVQRMHPVSFGITMPAKDGGVIAYSDLLAWERAEAPKRDYEQGAEQIYKAIHEPAPPSVSPRDAPHQGIRHQLKCWPRFFKAVLDGSKTFEARKADRKYAVGDTLVLCEWDPNTEAYTGAEPIERVVTYILEEGSMFGFKGNVVMAIHEAAQVGR